MRSAARCRGGATGIFSRRIEQRRWFPVWEPDLLRAQADAQRSVQVVCLTGLNETAFPRHDRAPGFDLPAQYPKRGDRKLPHGGTPPFLEAPLSARQVFYSM